MAFAQGVRTGKGAGAADRTERLLDDVAARGRRVVSVCAWGVKGKLDLGVANRANS